MTGAEIAAIIAMLTELKPFIVEGIAWAGEVYKVVINAVNSDLSDKTDSELIAIITDIQNSIPRPKED